MNYRNITTFIKSFVFDKLDIAIDNRMNEMFAHSVVYANDERIKLQSYESKEIVGDTNWKSAIIKVNPQDEYFTLGYQVYEPLSLVSFTPSGAYTAQDIVPIYRTFNTKFAMPFGTNPPIINNKAFNNKFSNIFGN
jgi:hypothetical protein